MSNLKQRTKKDELLSYQNNSLFSNFPIRTQSTQIIENTVMDSSLEKINYSPWADLDSWIILQTNVPSYSSLKRKPIDLELQGLSKKVMKKTWDNKEDEFWNTY
ncbi:MAG: hypothetical protein ACREAK_06300 [Nitrosarchaeum sp.]